MYLTEQRKSQIAIFTVFFILGTGTASWVSRIPDIKEALDISKSNLSLGFLTAAIGALFSMQLIGRAINAYGSNRVTGIMTLLFCGAFILPALAPTLPLFLTAMFIYGSAFGAVDVAMNTNANVVEIKYSSLVMSKCHSFFSLGSIAGGILGSFISSLKILPLWHLSSIGLILIVSFFTVMQWLASEQAPVDKKLDKQPYWTFPSLWVLSLGVLLFCGQFSECAIADWSAIFYREILEVRPGMDTAGFVVFYTAQLVGRLFGDWMVSKAGNRAVATVGCLSATAGFAISLLTQNYFLSLAGLICMGLGLSALAPIVIRVAGRVEGNSEQNIATASAIGYFGFLSGPPIIGFTAEIWGLRNALLIVCLCCFISSLLTYVIPADEPEIITGDSDDLSTALD